MSNYHQISFSNAARYIHSYLQNTALFNVAINQSFGATIPLDIFNEALNPTEHGSAFWFCWNKGDKSNYPPFFMAYELNRFDAGANPPIKILHDILQAPTKNCAFVYPNPTPPSLTETEFFLQNHTLLPLPVSAQDISNTVVETLNEAYMQEYPDGTPHPEFTKVNCCFFSSKDLNTGNPDDGFEAFTHQNNIKYVRYYFCLVRAQDDRVYPKLILFGVDDRGKNLTSADDSIILEVSWP